MGLRLTGPKSAANWAVGSFVGISAIMWYVLPPSHAPHPPLTAPRRENCRRARAKELAQMAFIQERFAHRHISKLKRRDASDPDSAVVQDGNPT